MSKTLYLIDGHSQLYQAFYAIPMLTSPAGQPVNAVYGFVNALRKILRERHPDYAAVVFDPKGPTFRHKRYAEYKAQRKPMPDELRPQIPVIQEAARLHGLSVLSVEGVEADDVIGTLAKSAAAKGYQVYLMTTDKDAEQLLEASVRILDAKKQKVIDLETLKEEKGIEPHQVVECMALSGDTSDNVPGIPGIGPKKALALIKEWGSLQGVFDNVEHVRGQKTRESIINFADRARLSHELVTIKTDVPLPLGPEDLAVKETENGALYEFYRRLGFRSLLGQVAGAEKTANRDYRLVADEPAFRKFLSELGRQTEFSIDLESTGTNPVDAEIVGLSFSWEPGSAYYIPVRAPAGQPKLPLKLTLRKLKPILEDETVRKVGQNLKYDIVLLLCSGVELKGVSFDTMVASYLLNTAARQHNLELLASEYLNYKTTPIAELIGKGRDQRRMDEVDVEKVCDYACEDADVALQLKQVMQPRLCETGVEELFTDVEMPLVYVLAAMEYDGIKIDPALLKTMSQEFAGKLNELETRIHEVAGEEFNVNSPKQLSAILFDKLGLPTRRRTRTGASTDARVLEDLARAHPLPALVLEYRQLSKLKSTYLDQLPQMISPKTGRIHASFNQAVTATGRLSSSDPNLQNIPIRTELGHRIREAFVPSRPEHVFLSVDYSQIDLRMLAHLSGDEALVQSFKNDEDIHASVATHIFGVPIADVSEQMRRAAKAVNFGIIYGLTPYGLSQQLGCTPDTARDFIDTYYERHQGVKTYMDRVVADAREKGFVCTILNRRRNLPEISSDNARLRALSERIARNTVIQGSAADLIKVAMNHIHQRITVERKKTRLLLQIHDELVFEAHGNDAAAEMAWISKVMEEAMDLRVPLKVKACVGNNWRGV